MTSGRVFSGFVGAHFRQTYTVMGDPTNLAARLTSRAEPGTVLVARSVLERTTRAFETADGGTITVKGKSQPIPVAIVTHDGIGQGEGLQTRAEFVGREDELTRLRELVEQASEGVGSTLVLSGPAGIGKSRLVARSLDETALTVLRCHGDRYAASTPYRTLQSLLRPLLGIPPQSTSAEAGARLREVVSWWTPEEQLRVVLVRMD